MKKTEAYYLVQEFELTAKNKDSLTTVVDVFELTVDIRPEEKQIQPLTEISENLLARISLKFPNIAEKHPVMSLYEGWELEGAALTGQAKMIKKTTETTVIANRSNEYEEEIYPRLSDL